jgi:hypothetical protein
VNRRLGQYGKPSRWRNGERPRRKRLDISQIGLPAFSPPVGRLPGHVAMKTLKSTSGTWLAPLAEQSSPKAGKRRRAYAKGRWTEYPADASSSEQSLAVQVLNGSFRTYRRKFDQCEPLLGGEVS